MRQCAGLCHITLRKAISGRIMSHCPGEGHSPPDYVTFPCGRRPRAGLCHIPMRKATLGTEERRILACFRKEDAFRRGTPFEHDLSRMLVSARFTLSDPVFYYTRRIYCHFTKSVQFFGSKVPQNVRSDLPFFGATNPNAHPMKISVSQPGHNVA